MPKITDLIELLAITGDDEIVIFSSAQNATRKVKVSTLLSGIGGTPSNLAIDWGVVTASQSGTTVTFANTYADANYAFIPFGVLSGATISVTLGENTERTPSSIVVYPASDNTKVYYIIIGELPS